MAAALDSDPGLASELKKHCAMQLKTFNRIFMFYFRIMATLPVTSCECEHSIGLLRLVKSSPCSNMGQNRLNGLALLHSHQGSFVTLTPEKVEDFAINNP